MGIGRASGENRALEAARQAIASPLLEVNINGAQGILFNITGSSNLSLWEVTEAAEEIKAAADPEANIIFGASFNERLGDEVQITVIATGFDSTRKRSSVRHEAAASTYGQEAEVSVRAGRERDFLEELERQRHASTQDGADDRDSADERAPIAIPIRPERTVGQPAPAPRRAFDADDLEIPSFLRRK
jgi:cell division protein FtsZ